MRQAWLWTSATLAILLVAALAIRSNPNKRQTLGSRRAEQIRAAIANGERETDDPSERAEEIRRWQDARRKGADKTPFDQPQDALVDFLARRLPEGEVTLSPANYAPALEQASGMETYSTALQQFLPRNPVPPADPSGGGSGEDASTSALGAWTALGPGNIGGRTRAILIHPTTPDVMWASGVAGGIWKSTNGGATWTPKADLLINIAVNSMILDPRNPDTLYAGTGEGFFNGDAVRGAGVMKSTDGGEHWAQLPSTTSSDFYYVQKIVMSKGSSQRLYAATRTGIFRSTDAGATWAKMLDKTSVNGCMDLAIQTDRALANVFAACGSFAQAAVYRALDTSSPQTWTSVLSPTGMGRASIAIAPSNQNTVYVLGSRFSDHQVLSVYRSTSSGSSGTWTSQLDLSGGNPNATLNAQLLTNPVYGVLTQCGFGATQIIAQGWYDNIIAVDPKDPNRVWVGGIDLFRSDDGGQNFGEASFWWFTPGVDPEYAHADNHTIVFHPQYDGVGNKTMFVGSDGGLFKTVDARAGVSYSPTPITPASPVCGNDDVANIVHWTNLNNGYAVTQFYDGAVYPGGNTFFGGTQDNGTLRGTTGGGPNAWDTIRGGDGGYVALNPGNTNMFWVENTGLSIQRSSNGGTSYQSVISGINEAGGNFLFITPFTQDPATASRMWIAGAFMWRADGAANAVPPNPYWTRASPFLGARVGAIAVAPSDSNRVYAGTGTGGAAVNGTVFTTNIGLTAIGTTVWSGSKPRADQNYVSWIAVHPTAPLTAWATVSTFNAGANTGHVFKTINGGTSWTNIDGSGATGVPDVPVHCVVVVPSDTNRIYIGTDIGVFVTLDGGLTWNRENTGFANVSIYSMKIESGFLYAFTHGRSVWRVAL